jgi:hypothetical protein
MAAEAADAPVDINFGFAVLHLYSLGRAAFGAHTAALADFVFETRFGAHYPVQPFRDETGQHQIIEVEG